VKRGDIVTVSVQGDYGKPRPAVVIQSDWLDETDSVLICLITSILRDASLYRLNVPDGLTTGLRSPSQIMADKIMAVRRDKCGPVIGQVEPPLMAQLGRMPALLIGATG
jgi:mRNA interferase MazF